MRVLVCGSRTFSDAPILAGVLDGLHDQLVDTQMVVVEGGAAGADRLARRWAEQWEQPVEEYAAEWDAYGKRAGIYRNQAMLTAGNPELVVAFIDKPLEESRGTAHMVRISREAGVKTIVVEVR